MDKIVLINPVPANRKVDAVYFNVEENELYREPILHFAITESKEKGIVGIQCYEPLVIDFENCSETILNYKEFIGLEFDNNKKDWKAEIMETIEFYNNEKEKL